MTRHLAEFNFGTLRYPWGDPRIAGFETALDQVNAIAARSPGFVWRMPDDAMDAAQTDPDGPLADRPNTASTLSVWTGAAPLYRFVTKTLHARIMARWRHLMQAGDCDDIFGAKGLQRAALAETGRNTG